LRYKKIQRNFPRKKIYEALNGTPLRDLFCAETLVIPAGYREKIASK
jgi:hypothetical protein